MPRALSIDSDHFDMPPRATSPHKHDHRAADISRLLDPSYSSSSHASSSAYVDRHGDLHDPDFRHFPIPHPLGGSTNKRYSPQAYAYSMATRPRWELIDEDALDDDEDDEEEMDFSRNINTNTTLRHRHSSHSSTYQFLYNNQQRPYTPSRTRDRNHFLHFTQPTPHSFDSDDTVLDEYDEDVEDEVFTGGGSGNDKDTKGCGGVSRIILRTKREFSKRRRSLDDACSRRSLDSGGSPHTSTLPPPDTDADAVSLSAPSHHHPLSHTLSHQSQSRVSVNSEGNHHHHHRQTHYTTTTHHRHSQREKSDAGHSSHTHTHTHNNHHNQSQSHSHSESSHEQHQHPYDPAAFTSTADSEKDVVWTPTCAQALKRQWQAVSLRIRFGVFRARRRMRNRLEGMC